MRCAMGVPIVLVLTSSGFLIKTLTEQSSKDDVVGVCLHLASGITFHLELDSGALKVSM